MKTIGLDSRGKVLLFEFKVVPNDYGACEIFVQNPKDAFNGWVLVDFSTERQFPKTVRLEHWDRVDYHQFRAETFLPAVELAIKALST